MGDAAAHSTPEHTSAYVSIRQHTFAYVSIRQHMSTYASIRRNGMSDAAAHSSPERVYIKERERGREGGREGGSFVWACYTCLCLCMMFVCVLPFFYVGYVCMHVLAC